VKGALLAGFWLLVASAGGETGSADRFYSSHLMVDQDVVVSSRITGIVQKILVDRGSVVTREEPLAELDPRELEQSLREAKEEMELRRAEFERARALSAGKVLSAADLDERRAQHQVAIARWEKAKTQRDYAVIRAPFAGVVTEKYAKIGQKVIEDRNEPLFKITALEPLLARVYLPEDQLAAVRRGDPVEVVPDRFPSARTTGTIQFISPTVDAASGTFQVIVRVRRDAAQPSLRPGIAVKLRFSGRPR
jgi:membrane fusion protein (multidrug efflux system)